MSFRLDASKLSKGIDAMESRFDIAMRLFADTAAIQLQNDARNNARWTDRTGDARKRLTCTAGKVAKGYKLSLSHGVEYGIWLELANEKRFAILEKTIRYTGALVIMPEFEKFMNKLKG